ncbi:hypothetical protein TNIN_60061 [Trichonephila inaurata madagascariensis]|uniref:Uncharacterized protein n=1 Tax=Trichonephila inaurata madagascariensis TaxID=2747483 RepID=A0A8X7CAJ9_9ARAC|nr:hypothetical protein TNIN_60061 [Trichonephila inaurata madagascariensis]
MPSSLAEIREGRKVDARRRHEYHRPKLAESGSVQPSAWVMRVRIANLISISLRNPCEASIGYLPDSELRLGISSANHRNLTGVCFAAFN